MSDQSSTPSATRRTLLRTTAWSVPAVSLAAAAPAFAASPANLLRVIAQGQWGEMLPVGVSAMIMLEFHNESDMASGPATVTLNLSAWAEDAFPLELHISPETDGVGMPTGWLEPTLEPEPNPTLSIPGVVVRVPGPTVSFLHGGGVPAGHDSTPLMLILMSPTQLSSSDRIPIGLSVSDPAWGIAPTSATEVTPMEQPV